VQQYTTLNKVEGADMFNDRLFRHYLRHDELAELIGFLFELRCGFTRVPARSVDWQSLGLDLTRSALPVHKVGASLTDVFGVYFSKIVDKAGEAAYCWRVNPKYRDDYGQYCLKTVVSQMPQYFYESERTLEQLDALGPDDPPFWMDDKNYPQHRTREDEDAALAKGDIGVAAYGSLSDGLVEAWAKKMVTPAAKRRAASTMTNALEPHQRRYLLDLADKQELA
jgi:hypothetical protein